MKVAAEFVTSAAGAEGLPKDGLPEIAVVGRSNVGKSSLINALVRKKLARTSAAPGKTRLANFYRVAVEGRSPFYLVDLPGYGYARAPRQAQGGAGSAEDRRRQAAEEFDALAAAYFGNRVSDPRFRGVFVLVDSRHPGLDIDRSAWHWLERLGVHAHVVATKIDKLTRSERQRHLAELEKVYSRPVTPSSADTGEGLDQLWKTIASLTIPARQ
ncbi:MAG TPA: ribosome biogenesis GTP-binding protein YihA/YsxC [Hyphomicrobiaceae bacterium]|nr:ribosome biogenesis GTP-binding protein YihA/YsxC [Hyphomicrobiaceae bacterium]